MGGQEDESLGPAQDPQSVERLEVDLHRPGSLVHDPGDPGEQVLHDHALGGDEGKQLVSCLSDDGWLAAGRAVRPAPRRSSGTAQMN